jgi:hypothetical protein
MTEERTLRVRLFNTPVDLPIFEDEQTTLRLASQVEDRIRKHEAEKERVSTQEWALLVAYEYACEAAALESEQQDLTKALERIAERLNRLAAAED